DRAHLRLEPREVERRLKRLDRPRGRADARPSLAGRELRMAPEIRHAVQPRTGDAGGIELVDHLARGERAEHTNDCGLQRSSVCEPRWRARETRIAGKRLVAEHLLAKAREFALVLHAEKDSAAIAGLKRTIGRNGRVVRARTRRRRTPICGEIRGEPHPLAERLQHRDLDRGAFAGAPAAQKRRQDGGESVHAGGDICDRNARLARCLFGAGDRQQASLALHEQVVGLLCGVRSARPIAGDAAPDERRFALAQRRRAHAEALYGTGGKVVDEYIRCVEELLQHRLRRRMLHIKGEALLGAVGPDEMRRLALHRAIVGSRRIACPGALYLDDACAQLGELARRERAGNDLLERDNRDAFERPHANSTLRPGRAIPVSRVLQRAPGPTGWASVMTPVVTISPAASAGASGCLARSSSRCASAASGLPRTFAPTPRSTSSPAR